MIFTMSPIAFLFFLNVVNASIIMINNEPPSKNVKENRRKLISWSDAAYKWMMGLNCSDTGVLCGQECNFAKVLEKRDIRVYAAEPIPEQKYGAVFLEGDSNKSPRTYHDSILVLDPFPNARFGHPIIAFYVDINISDSSYCEDVGGFIIENTSTCMQPIPRVSYSKNYNFRARFLMSKVFSCQEMLFLPLVYPQTDLQIQANDRLECKSNIDGFHKSCPELRPKSQTNHVDCHRLRMNKDCQFLENTLRGRCSASQSCDHAVLLSGGWNRQLSDVESFSNIFKMKELLMLHGYRDTNIEIFLANGEKRDNVEKEETVREGSDGINSDEDFVLFPQSLPPKMYHSASVKYSLRNHIQTVCDSNQCADSLFIYLNNPVMMDGSALLWDLEDNGVPDETEVYTPKELMRDVSHCRGANRVIIVADQSYGQELVKAADARSFSLNNVVLFASTEEFNFSPNKDRLTQYLLKYRYNDICLANLKKNFSDQFQLPVYVGSQPDLLNSTLVGGPCTNENTFLNDPQMEQYRGCRLPPIA